LELKDSVLSGSGKKFDIRIHALCAHEPDIEKWIERLEYQADQPMDVAADWAAHCQKLTAGRRDGFLIDCWPDLSLRVILGSRQDDFPDVLHPGVWQHVAVVMDKGRLEVYLNGNKLQRR